MFVPAIAWVAIGVAGNQYVWHHPTRPAWTHTVHIANTPMQLRLWRKRDAPTELEVLRNGKVIAHAEDDLFLDLDVAPYLHSLGGSVFLGFAGDPGAGSGQYATVWKIAGGGRVLKRLGAFMDADMRHWFGSGLIRETRPRKYATDDMLKVYPKLFETEKFIYMRFVSTYRFDRRTSRFRFQGVRPIPYDPDWLGGVRFPGRQKAE